MGECSPSRVSSAVMTIQTVSIEALQKVRQYISNGLALPDVDSFSPHLNELDTFADIPEPDSLDALGGVFNMGGLADFEPDSGEQGSDSWTISMVNPGDVLHKLPSLNLKPGFRLVAFVFQGDPEGKGIVWAVPEDYCTTDYLDDALASAAGIDHPPQPAEALPDFMGAIEGDRSTNSFFIASILRRELLEFGAMGSAQQWTHHRFINAVPKAIQPYWRDDYPKNLQPKLNHLPDGRTAIEFFTCRVKPPIEVVRHIDQYLDGHYTAKSVQRVIVKLKAR